jgi:hypothetical protein
MCSIDNLRIEQGQVLLGGVAFAGSRGIRKVQVRVDEGEWLDAELEPALSPYSWVRYRATLPANDGANVVQARAMDGSGAWQSDREIPMFPGGVAGPTVRKLSI